MLLLSILAGTWTLRATDKLPMPLLDDVKSAVLDIRKQYNDEYSRETAENKLTLAEKLLKRGESAADKASIRFALYSEAMRLPAEAGDVSKGENARVFQSAYDAIAKVFSAVELTLTKDGVCHFGGKEYVEFDKLQMALTKEVHGSYPILVRIDGDASMKSAEALVTALPKAGFKYARYTTTDHSNSNDNAKK